MTRTGLAILALLLAVSACTPPTRVEQYCLASSRPMDDGLPTSCTYDENCIYPGVICALRAPGAGRCVPTCVGDEGREFCRAPAACVRGECVRRCVGADGHDDDSLCLAGQECASGRCILIYCAPRS